MGINQNTPKVVVYGPHKLGGMEFPANSREVGVVTDLYMMVLGVAIGSEQLAKTNAASSCLSGWFLLTCIVMDLLSLLSHVTLYLADGLRMHMKPYGTYVGVVCYRAYIWV